MLCFLKNLHGARMGTIYAHSGCTSSQYIPSPNLKNGHCWSSVGAMEAADLLIQMAVWRAPYMVSFLHTPILGRGRKESRPVQWRLKWSRIYACWLHLQNQNEDLSWVCLMSAEETRDFIKEFCMAGAREELLMLKAYLLLVLS